jgi:hypothetical protein
MFGIGAYAGRALAAGDDRAGAAPVAVMSYRLWQERYGADPSVIGAVFNVDDKPFTVVGIAPPGFFGDTLSGTPPDFFLPLNTQPLVESDADLNKYDTHWLELIGRIQPGARPASIEAAPNNASKMLSMRGCLTRRDARAPSAMLNDVCRRRSMPRTSRRLATLAQTISRQAALSLVLLSAAGLLTAALGNQLYPGIALRPTSTATQ